MEPLTHDDALALNRHADAQLRAAEVITQARAIVARDWGELPAADASEQIVRRDPLWFSRHYPRAAARSADLWPDDAWFEWHGRRDTARPPAKRVGQVVFGAGVVFPAAAAPADQSDWIARMQERGFEYGNNGVNDPYQFLCRYLTLDDLAAHEGVERQAGALAQFVVGAFRTLAADPPTEDER
jgi:hypothetical protein